MKRAVVNVATTPYYQRGQARLEEAIAEHGGNVNGVFPWGAQTWPLPGDWPQHSDVPYAFKAFALKQAADQGFDTLLWCDSCILPIRSMEPLLERIEREGYWMSRNGWSNYEWTADSAYRDLFQEMGNLKGPGPISWTAARALNRTIPHVVATAFGINVKHPKGRAFLDEYYRLANETRAFCGPWWNLNNAPCPNHPTPCTRCAPCGPPDVRGHRHDQTAASVIAWRLGFELTSPPDVFAYKGGETEQTILMADGSYV